MDAIATRAPGRVDYEFLRPATLNALTERLKDETRPVDILHFDGHGVFREVTQAETERYPERYGRSVQSEIQRELMRTGLQRGGADAARPETVRTDADTPVGIGFLVFEQPPEAPEPGTAHLVSAADLADNLNRARVGLVVLSACQTAALGTEGTEGTDPLASVAGRLSTTGIPAVLAMSHAVLVATTRALFGELYKALARGRGLAAALDEARVWLANNPDKFPIRRGDGRTSLKLYDWFLPALFHGGTDTTLLAPPTADQAARHPAPPQAARCGWTNTTSRSSTT
jgi:CHAT domain-containing protein